MEERDEIVRGFLAVTHEDLDQLDSDLVALERAPDRPDLLGRVLLAVATVRRTSGALRLARLETLTRAGEDLLSRLRDSGCAVTPEVLSGLLDLVEVVRALLRTVEQTGREGPADHGVLLARLAALGSAGAGRGRAVPPVAPAPVAPPPVAPPPVAPPPVVPPPVVPPPVTLPAGEDDRLGELLVAAGAAHADDVVVAVLEQELAGDERRIGDILLDQGAVAPDDLDDVLRLQAEGRRVPAPQEPGVATVLHDALTALAADMARAGEQGSAAGATQDGPDRRGAGPVLLVRLGRERHAALPLPLVTRVADVAAGAAVRVGSGEVVPYRGGVLPLARLSAPRVASAATPPEEVLHVVVCSHHGRSVGLVVDEVLAVVDEALLVRPSDEPGLLGVTILRHRVTELLDVRAAVLAADPGFFGPGPSAAAARTDR